MDGTLLTALALIPALVIAIVFHEVAHGWTALALGDPTAKERKRLSFNPIRHVDPIGTLLVPGGRLRNPRFGMMAVAAAGPGMNLALAAIGAVVLGLLVAYLTPDAGLAGGLIDLLAQGRVPNPSTGAGFALMAVLYFILINIFLALFNMLPIPPFDGSHIVEGLLPRRAALVYDKLRPFGFPLLFLLLLVIPWFFPGLGIVERVVLPPVIWAQEKYLALASLVAGG